MIYFLSISYRKEKYLPRRNYGYDYV